MRKYIFMAEKKLLGQTLNTPLNNLDEGECKGLTFGEVEIFVVKHDDQLHAYQNKCPHLGIALEWLEDQFLDMEKQFIHCSTHGALFLIETGECVSGPCLGQFLTPVNIEYAADDAKFYL
jgi:nitrite reductase/ring-hydroxylating ferredoxin subunit